MAGTKIRLKWKFYFGYYVAAVNQIHAYFKREKMYLKNWYAPCNEALFLESVQVFVRNTFGSIYLIFKGIQAYGCIIIVLVLLLLLLLLLLLIG